jgi:hypothetical protein
VSQIGLQERLDEIGTLIHRHALVGSTQDMREIVHAILGLLEDVLIQEVDARVAKSTNQGISP